MPVRGDDGPCREVEWLPFGRNRFSFDGRSVCSEPATNRSWWHNVSLIVQAAKGGHDEAYPPASYKAIIASISISAPRGSAATCTALLAGNGFPKYSAYTAFTR